MLENGRHLGFLIGPSGRIDLMTINMPHANFGACITICTIHPKNACYLSAPLIMLMASVSPPNIMTFNMLNRIITGCLNATTIPCVYALAGISPPHIRRKVTSNADRCLQEDGPRHPLHDQRPANHRLPSRSSFLESTEALNTSKQDSRTTLWVDEWNALGERSTLWRDRGIIPNDHLASGRLQMGAQNVIKESFLGGNGMSLRSLS